MEELLKNISKCQICKDHLPNHPRPVLTATVSSKLVIIGQAPGRIVHETGIPWNDKSGARLREWMGVSKEEFYDSKKVAIIPMGFCYPGTGKTGDLPPRKECATEWHNQLMSQIKPELVLLIGSYAQNYYLGKQKKKTLTETVQHFEEYLPHYFVLPHPSPRNNIWMKKNPWFEEIVLPVFKHRILEMMVK
jgi:uracil-DNA glycosylase family 4